MCQIVWGNGFVLCLNKESNVKDILAIDGLYANGKMHIIELNSTAIGIHRHYWEEDTKVLCELAVTRMSEIYVK